MDCTGFDWGSLNHRIHGDLLAWFAHVHDGRNVVHGDGPDERFELHVHGDRNECQWDGFGFDCEFGCSSFDGARLPDFGERHGCCEHPVGGVMDCASQ